MQVSTPRSGTAPDKQPDSQALAFADLPLTEALTRGITDAGFTHCTPIQDHSLPLALEGRDIAGQAQTGTGKTAAYLIALFQHLSDHAPLDTKEQGPRALILAPTRELAVQIHKDAETLGTHLGYRLGLAFGGTDYDKQRDSLAAGVDVLIGTPGRTIDFFKQGVFGLKGVQVLVLDEADRMFDLGFIKDIRYVLRRLPDRDRRLNLLFSATLSHRVLELAYEHMNDPELIRIEPDKMTADRVRQVIYYPSNEEKLPLLLHLLKQMDARRTMIFVNRRREAERLRDALNVNDIEAEAISGDVPQRKRLRMLKDFQEGKLPILIGTDVASRGLHVPGVSHVFNYDLPEDVEDYVHRIGRTARAGESGDAISFGCEDYVMSLPDIEEYIGHKIPLADIDRPAIEAIAATVRKAPPRPRRHGSQRHGESRHGGSRKDGRPPRSGGKDAGASGDKPGGQETRKRRSRRRRSANRQPPNP